MSAIEPLIPGPSGLLPAPPHAAISAVNARPTGAVQWRSRTRDEWIGREGRSAVGTVRRLGTDYLAIDSTGMLTGFFSSLAEAELSLMASRADRCASRAAPVIAAAAGIAALAGAIVGLIVLTL